MTSKGTSPSRSAALVAGAVTLLVSGLLRQGLGLLTLVVTARLLTPEDFGVVAYFMIAVAFLEMLQRQISMSLIRIDAVTSEHFETALTMQFIFGISAASLFWVAQPLIAGLGITALTQLAPTMSLMSIIIAFRSPRFVLFERNLQFGRAAAEETANRIIYSVVAIWLAWLWRDYWAIVVATFVSQLARNVWTFSFAPMSIRLSLSRWRDSFSFSTWSMGAQIAQFFAKDMPQLVIGLTLGLADAGLFRLGNRITTLVTTQFFAPMQRVIYPGLADVSRNTDRRQEAFVKLNSYMLAILLPISVGIALIAEDVILAGVGYKWIVAAQVIWILAPLKALETLQANVRAAVYVEGSTKVLFVRNIILLVIVCLFMRFGVNFDFFGAVIAAGASSLAALFMTLVLARRFGTGGFFDPLLCGWRSFLSSAAMAIAVVAIGWLLETDSFSLQIFTLILIKVLIGIIAYVGIHFLLWTLAGKPDGFESVVLSFLSRIRRYVAKRRAQ
ncbi:oligosaccharide flippase family protein [Pseudohalocynthiibacter sp. F2068]|jgi:O-antigen/teichoic acid export membrane protein|uniref:oligosaccharide flippase family protein n=1 Tax=Pseudohalocynthiibacter sp. F2068 TaxID=2926418 RepID=UPI001FF6D861|nr:oligosaccharide flippase family protein [Pseudohalocynthiibacter sp. F2068]MCK0103895.1 oligosaccharide flippase family protein [Pseudohalocynthiibacter sp. F2068]